MKQVNILVEGAKDFYFLHEFIRQRLGSSFVMSPRCLI